MNAAEDAIHVIIPIFCVATMFAMGLDVTLAEAVAPLRQKLALGITVLVNNVLIPLLGFLIVALPALLAADWLANLGLKDLALTGGAQMGFLLLMLASGSLLGPTLARIAGANEATAKGVMVMLAVASAVLVPVELKLLCSSNAISACSIFPMVDAGSVFWLLLVFQLLPLVVGIAIKARYDAAAVRLRPLMMELMGLTLLVLLALLFMSRYQVAQWPGEAKPVRAVLFSISASDTITPLTEPAAIGNVTPTLQGLGWGASLQKLEHPTVIRLPADTTSGKSTWAIVDANNKFEIWPGAVGKAAGVAPWLILSGPNSLRLRTSPGFSRNFTATIGSLQNGEISTSLREDLAAQHFALPSNLATTVSRNVPNRWMLTNAAETYFFESESTDGKVAKQALYQMSLSPLAPAQAQTEPAGFLGKILAFLEGLPIVGEIVSFTAQFVVWLVPYALLAALAALLLLIGNYTGVAVRNIVAASGEGIPRAMAIATAVRNVSIALLLADQYYNFGTDQGAVPAVLVFYVVSLIVTAHQAVTWGKESAEQKATNQDQARMVTDATSAPAV